MEIQSSEDENIASRINIYGINHTKTVKMEETFIKDKVVTTEVRNVDVDPFKIIIYATLDITKKDGVELYFNTKSKFHVNTTPYSFEKGDVTIEAIPFVNIARMTIEELNNSELDFK